MKKILCFLALLAAFGVLTAASNTEVDSLSINNCGVLTGNVKLSIDVEPGGRGDEASNNCQAEPDGTVRLTFFVPSR